MSTGPSLGSGDFFGNLGGNLGPHGPYGAWPGCGCSSLLMVLAGIILVCAGGMRFFGQ